MTLHSAPPIRDDPFYDADPHKDTHTAPESTRVRMSNQGLHIFSSFDKVIILQRCHRVHQRQGATLTDEDIAYDERGQRFLQVVTRLRDCAWTENDYYWICRF